jgi:uncharacterized damage-inducible protein DinB
MKAGPDEIIRQIQEGYSGEPWHGFSTMQILQGVTARQAFALPPGEGHSIAEIVLHLVSWQNEVRRRLQGQWPELPAEGDWPTSDQQSEDGWQRCLERLRASMERLLEELGRLSAEALDKRVGDKTDRFLGSGMSMRAMAYGVVSHNAYHSGQIAVLKKQV